MSARALARRVLVRVLEEGAYSHIALSAEIERAALAPRDRGLATRLVYGTLTWLSVIDRVLERHARGGLGKLDAPVLCALRVAAYQMLFLDRIPDRAAIHEAVEDAKRCAPGNPRAPAMVNGMLRGLERSRRRDRWWREEDRARKPVRYLAERWALPPWLANRLVQMLGIDEAEACARAMAEPAPLWARLRPGAGPLEGAAPHEMVEGAVRLDGLDLASSDALKAYAIAIQDIGSQAIGLMALPDEPAESALDACAGLGGKSWLLADRGARVVAVEPVASKVAILTGLGAPDRLEAFEGTLADWRASHPERRFKSVLVDAPCTALGTLRRHPEIRTRRRESDINALVEIQRALLDEAAPLVEPGGRLVYAVCTFTREEGPRQAERFLARHAEFARDTSYEGWAADPQVPGALRTWPHTHDADAFWAARFIRSIKPAPEG